MRNKDELDPIASGGGNQAAPGKQPRPGTGRITTRATALGETEPGMEKRTGTERAIIRYPIPVLGT